MDRSKPTARQLRVLRLIARGVASGIQPSIRDLMASTGATSPNGVVCHLTALEKKGFIRRRKRISRAISVNWGKYPYAIPVPAYAYRRSP